MKRLTLTSFQATTTTLSATDQLLGQVLGACHDDHTTSTGNDTIVRKKPGRTTYD